MDKEKAKSIKQPILFFDDCYESPNCPPIDEDEDPSLKDLKKCRLQILLAVQPWGIPSLTLCDAYKKMFRRELNIKALGFEHLSDMISQMTDIFTVQEPDEITAIMFPGYAHDKILHDARLGHEFDKQIGNDVADDRIAADPETLISYAWLNRDDDFPPNVVLAGERYREIILPMTSANLPNTRGVYQAMLAGAANPNRFYVNLKGPDFDRFSRLSSDIARYFENCNLRIETFNVPEEFLYPGFPCLVYIKGRGTWERCSVLRRSHKSSKVLVETVDFGGMRTASRIHLYLMPKEFLDLPKQGVLVSMIGVKSNDGPNNWSAEVGTRLLCFSNANYWLDCVLLDPGAEVFNEGSVKSMQSSDGSTTASTRSLSQKGRRLLMKDPQFEIILCDRNDEEMDIYLDEILVLENHAVFEEQKSFEIRTHRDQFKKAIAALPRPKNPFQ